jgi:hypothetical protein
MFRGLLLLTVGLAIVSGLLTAASSVIGSAVDTTLLAALVSPVNSRAIYVLPNQISLFDLKRSLRADHQIPFENVEFISFDYSATSPAKVIVATTRAPEANGDPGGLYLYNIFNGRLTTAFQRETAQPNTNTMGFYPILSPDEQKLAFLHPADAKLYLFDTASAQVSQIAFDAVDDASGKPDFVTWNWSPDSTKIAIRGAKTLYIVGIGSQAADLIAYPLEGLEYYPVWSEDSRYLLLQRTGENSQTRNFPVKLIDSADGSEHPFTKDLEASGTWWYGCENHWLTYTVVTDELREGYILDLQDGTTVRVNDAPELAQEPIEQIVPVLDCQHFLVKGDRIGEPGMRTPMELDVRHTYVFDLADQTAEYLDDTSALFQQSDEKEIYYQILTEDRSFWQVYKRPIDPLGEPVLVSQYPPLSLGYFEWASDMTFATYLETPPSQTIFGGNLRRLDAATGQTFPLTSDDEIVRTYVQYELSDLRDKE